MNLYIFKVALTEFTTKDNTIIEVLHLDNEKKGEKFKEYNEYILFELFPFFLFFFFVEVKTSVHFNYVLFNATAQLGLRNLANKYKQDFYSAKLEKKKKPQMNAA